MRARPFLSLIALAMMSIVAISVGWGRSIQADTRVKLGAAPLVGAWRWRPNNGTLLPIVVAACVIAALPRVAAAARFSVTLAVTAVAAAGFTLTLAASDGWAHVLDPVVHPTEYWANLATLPPAGDMLRHYGTTDFLLRYSVHAKGHPPGFLLILKGLAAIGLGHPWVTGALSYLGVAAVPAAVMIVVRAVVSESTARTIAPFLVLAPYAVWMGTSADAFYAGVAASAVACLVSAVQAVGRSHRRLLAGAGGALLGGGLFLTYGLVPFLAVPAVAALALRPTRQRLLEVAGFATLAATAVTLTFGLAGFWWWDGLRTTRTFYWWGTAHYRPWRYFLVGNLGASLIAVGPVAALGLATLRNRLLWWVIGGALVGIFCADLSQYSKAEVERIWLLFFPWLIPAVAAFRPQRAILAVHAGGTVALQTWLVSKW